MSSRTLTLNGQYTMKITERSYFITDTHISKKKEVLIRDLIVKHRRDPFSDTWKCDNCSKSHCDHIQFAKDHERRRLQAGGETSCGGRTTPDGAQGTEEYRSGEGENHIESKATDKAAEGVHQRADQTVQYHSG